jgi:nucleotide-binding universal stress UspA family protein
VFDRVIAGIDGSRASFAAGRQAARLTRPTGSLTLLAAADPHLTLLNRWGPRTLVDEDELQELGEPSLAEERLVQYAGESLAAMRGQLDAPASIAQRIVDGTGPAALREAATSEGAELIAVGDHGYKRLIGIARASTTTELLHEAPCSVLVARPAFDPVGFPSTIVVGVDGSDESFAALDLAGRMVEESAGAATARVIVADKEAPDVSEITRRAAPLPVVRTPVRAVKALAEASEGADLVIVGARGLSGAAALGSVSERVAHGAKCSVLVRREAA